MMETRKDFQKINDEMEKDSKIAKIKLPENLLK
jgi:hypothetical protein